MEWPLRCSARTTCACLLIVSATSAAVAAQGTQTAQAERAAAQAPRVATPVTGQSDRVVTAVRASKPIDIDGRFDDEVYQTVEATGGFTQQEPSEGEPVSERTEVWVLFDDENLYISGKCFDSHPERMVLTELRRDSSNIFQNESVTIVLDTFHDLRNGFKFQTNALGAVQESAVVDEVNVDSWNTVWDVRSGRYDWGWGFEMAIPFKSLRYPGAGPQVWGINFRRVIKWKNELAYLTPMPRSFGLNAIYHMGSAATLVGLETPQQSLNLELKPYVVSSLTTDRTARQPFSNDPDADTGFDFKYGLTRGLILDATVNTDFAQVEEDQQQVNLTRYSLFFPEKRDFFLEGQAIFSFGGLNFGQNANPGEVPVMFFSRQIGLSRGQAVPVIGGARVTGRAGKFQIGAVNIETGDNGAAGAVDTNFTAVRVKRDILRRSNIGIIATRRAPAGTGRDRNLTYGADVNLFLFANVVANVYYARTDTPGFTRGEDSYRGRFEFAGDRYGWTAEHLLIAPDFNPEVGFARRKDFRRSFGQFRFSPRPRNNRVVRRYSYTGSIDYITDAERTAMQERELRGTFNVEYQSGDSFNVEYTRNYERLPAFEINPGTTVPAGGYHYQNVRTQYSLGQRRKVSGRIFTAHGTLYKGKKTEAGYVGRLGLVPQFAVEPSVSLNWVRLPYGDFEAPVISSRLIFTPNARTALSSFIQYNGGSHTMSTSVRLRWEYRPGSEVFIVYSDGRDTLVAGYPDLLNRSLALKVTRLLRF
jgi:hypothetical protein